MNQRILLITGWGGGTRLLDPLKQALAAQGYEVELCNIFNALDEQALQQKVELARQFDVIAGWSLGGQLATVLADQVQKQHGQEKVLITLGSNPCFVANDTWPMAMDQPTFQQFKQSFEQDAISTLKKFGYMVCQGTATTKAEFIILQSLIQAQSIETLRQGLFCLEYLNNVDILRNYPGHQYHVFAKQDFLVSYKVQRNFQKFNAKFLNAELLKGSHGLPVFHFELVTDKICQYLQKMD